MVTKILTTINLVGCIASFIYLYWSMRTTTRDDAHPVLVRFEWALLVAVGLTALHQVRILVGNAIPIYVPTGFSHLTIWIAALIFARYLRVSFK